MMEAQRYPQDFDGMWRAPLSLDRNCGDDVTIAKRCTGPAHFGTARADKGSAPELQAESPTM